jgi:hypothetical protein
MKPYFSKLLTEKERGGSSDPSLKTGKRIHYIPDHDYDEQPTRLPISRHRQFGYDCKHLSDVLRPLKGFLFKNVGRLWDDVYSELCQSLDRRSVSGQHVFQHMKDYVEINTYFAEDGSLWTNGRRGPEPVLSYYQPGSFYVHPVSGVLSFLPGPPRRRYQRPEDPDRIDLTDGTYFGRFEGIWFHCTFIKVEKDDYSHYRWSKHWVEVITHKRQLGKKELNKVVYPYLQKYGRI